MRGTEKLVRLSTSEAIIQDPWDYAKNHIGGTTIRDPIETFT